MGNTVLSLDLQHADRTPLAGAVVTVSYDREVRLSSGGTIPPLNSGNPVVVQAGTPPTVTVVQNDDPTVASSDQGFAVIVETRWTDPATLRPQYQRRTVSIGSAQGASVALSALADTQAVPAASITVTPAQINKASTDASNALATANDAESKVNQAVASQDSATAQNINTGTNTQSALASYLNGDASPAVRKDSQIISLADHVKPTTAGDLTSAIQSFINTLVDGDELLWGKGTWRVDGTLTFSQNDLTVRLRQGAFIDRTQAAITPNWAANTAYAANQYVRANSYTLQCTVGGTSGTTAPTPPTTLNATVTDGTVTWARVIAPEAAACLSFSGARCTVKGRGSVTSQPVWDGLNTQWSSGVLTFTGDKPSVRDITLTNVVKCGIGFFNTNGLGKVEGVTITGNYPSAQWTEVETGHYGIFFDPYTTDSRVTVRGNNIDSCVQGWCGGNYGAGSSVGSNVSGNTITRCWNHGIYNSGGLTDMVCTGNTFRDCSRPIVMSDSGHIVTGNTMTASSTGSTLYWTAAIQMRNAIDCVIADNIIKGDIYSSAAAIDLSHVSGGTTISGNQITGNRIKATTANQGYAIRVGTTASTVMARNTIQGNIVEGPGVTNYGIITLAASASATDTTGNVILGNTVSILAGASGIYVTNLTRPKILSNIVQVGFDASAAVTIGGISLVGSTVSASVRDNTITCTAAWGANVTLRAIWEWASTVTSSQISDNQITLDTTKLASGTPYVLSGGGPVLKASGTGAPAFVCGPGSMWLRTDGSTGSTLYVKESAANQSTWTAK